MTKVTSIRFAPLALMLALAGCASGPGGGSIYVPMGGGEPSRAPEPPRTAEPEQNSEQEPEPRVWRKSEEPAVSEPEQPSRAPSYRESGDALPAAAVTLIRDADSVCSKGILPEQSTFWSGHSELRRVRQRSISSWQKPMWPVTTWERRSSSP